MAELESTMQWKVDITSFTAAMQEAKKALSNTNSEFKLTTSTMDKWSNNTAGVEAKLKQLSGQLEANKRILDIYNSAWEQAKKEFGETSPEAERLGKKVEEQQIKVNKAQVQINKYTDQLNKMQAEQKESETATEKLNKQIDEQQQKVDELKAAYKNSLVGDNPEETKKLAKELKSASEELASMKKQMKEADKAADDLDASLDETDDAARTASEGFTVFKGALANLVSQGISKVIEGVKELARQTFEAGSSFESSMSNVAAISGATAHEMDQLASKAEEMGAKTKFSASEAADAFGYMAMAGWKTEQMLGGIEGIMNLAAASGTDLATASDIVTDALTGMGYAAEDAGKLADVMAAASSNANTNVELMGGTFKYAAPIVGALGYSMEDTAVAIGLMANAGIKGEQAGTALRSIMTRLSVDTDGCTSFLKECGIEVVNTDGSMRDLSDVIVDLRHYFTLLSESEQTQLAKMIAGQEAMSGLLAIVNAAPEDFNKLTLAVENSNGAAEKMANTMNDNVGGQITLLKSKIEGIMIKTFEKMSGSIRKAINTVSETLDNVDWDAFAEGAGNVAEKIAEFFSFIMKNGGTILDTLKVIATAFVTYKAVTSISDVTSAFTGMFKAVKGGVPVMDALTKAIGANPYALLAAGIVAAGGAIAVYVQKAREARLAQYELNDEQQAAIDKITDYVDTYNTLKEARDKALADINSEYGYIESLKDQYNDLIDSNGKVKEGYEDRAEYIKTRLAEALGIELDAVNELISENGKLSDSIDDLINKKKAEAVLMANEEMYNEAIKNRATAFDDLVNAQKAVTEAEEKLTESQEAANKVWSNYNELMKTSPIEAERYLSTQGDVITANNIAKTSFEEANKKLGEAEKAWQDYNTVIQNYEGLGAAIVSGDVTKINEALLALQNGFITAENSNRESLEQQVKTYEKNLSDLQHAIQTGTPYVTQDMVDQAQSMVNAAKAELDKLAPQAAEAGKTGANEFNDNIKAKKDEAQTAGKELAENADAGAKTGAKGMINTGEDAGADFNKGVDSKKDDAKTKGEALADKAVEGASSENGENGGAKKSGSNFGEGFFNGIGSWLTKVWNKGWELAKSALGGLKKGQEEGSPSKLTRKSGVYFGEGYEQGIKSTTKDVIKAASNLGKESTDALLQSISKQKIEAENKLSGLKDTFAELKKVYTDAVKDRTTELKNSFNLFDDVKLDESKTSEELTANLQHQVDALKEYNATMADLEKRINNKALIESLRSQGISSLDTLKALDEMSDAELKQYVKLFNKRNKLAKERALMENEDLKESTEKQIQKMQTDAENQVKSLDEAYAKRLEKLSKSVKKESEKVGTSITDGIAKGIKKGMASVTSTLKIQSSSMVKTVQTALKVNSPSKVFADKVGKWLPLGIAQGFENAMPETEKSMRDSVMGAVNTLKTDLSGANLQLANAVSGNASVSGVGGVVGNSQQIVNFYQTNNSPKALDRLTVYRETNSLLFNAKVRLSNV